MSRSLHPLISVFRWIVRLGFGVAAVLGLGQNVVASQSGVLRPIDRVEKIRQDLLALDTKEMAGDPDPGKADRRNQLAQWYNWSNWGNYWRNF